MNSLRSIYERMADINMEFLITEVDVRTCIKIECANNKNNSKIYYYLITEIF